MGLQKLDHPIESSTEIALSAGAPVGSDEVEAGEGYLRDELADRLFELAKLWLIAGSQQGNVTYVVGSTRGRFSRSRRTGIIELISRADGAIGVNALEIDPRSGCRQGDEIRGRLAPNRNPAIDTISLAWLAKAIDPDGEARQAGPAAYQEIAAGLPTRDLLSD